MNRTFEEARADYQVWINDRLAQDEFNRGYGKCVAVTADMVKAFPDLDRRKGLFRSVAWGDREHWWCRHGKQIVDPTALQHPDGELFPMTAASCGKYYDLTDVSHEEAIERGIIASGKCLDCGNAIYGVETDFCSQACKTAYLRYMETGEL